MQYCCWKLFPAIIFILCMDLLANEPTCIFSIVCSAFNPLMQQYLHSLYNLWQFCLAVTSTQTIYFHDFCFCGSE